MAAKTRRLKTDATAHPVPQNRDQAVEAIAEIGRLQRERDLIQTQMNDELAALRQRYEEQAAPLADRIKALSAGVQVWCTANRATLTQGGKVKFARLASGEIKWRMRPPSVTVRGKDVVIALLKDLGLNRFLRTKEEVNKDAILAEADAVKGIKGITIKQAEDFVIVPFETQLEEVA